MVEKIGKYLDLKIEIKRIWKCKEVLIVPIVIGALGTVHNNFDMWMGKLDAKMEFQILVYCLRLVYWELQES